MARFRVGRDWAAGVRKQITNRSFTSMTLSYNEAAKFLIVCAAENDFPLKVTNLGAGVKRITAVENVCPHCGGKGYIK